MTVAFLDSMRAESARLEATDGHVAARRRVAVLVYLGRLVARVLFFFRQLRTVALSLMGFGLLVAASYIWAGTALALAAGAVSCFALEYLSGGDQ